jgi:hypothetical protein
MALRWQRFALVLLGLVLVACSGSAPPSPLTAGEDATPGQPRASSSLQAAAASAQSGHGPRAPLGDLAEAVPVEATVVVELPPLKPLASRLGLDSLLAQWIASGALSELAKRTNIPSEGLQQLWDGFVADEFE